MVEGETSELIIERLGHRGDGIAVVNGESVFVPCTAPHDVIEARIQSGERRTGRLVRILEAGPHRIPPPCPHFGDCGGCALQHIQHQAYITWKEKVVRGALANQRFVMPKVESLVRVAPGTRRRATFAFHLSKNRVMSVGFNALASHRVVDVWSCGVLHPSIAGLLPALRSVLPGVVKPGERGDVQATYTDTGLDVLIVAPGMPAMAARERLAAFAETMDLARLGWRKSKSKDIEPIVHRRAPVVAFAGVGVEPPPDSFLQPSREGERVLADLLSEAIGPEQPLLELFCGAGSFTFPLARGRNVHAVDGREDQTHALQMAAYASGFPITTEVRNLGKRPYRGQELAPYRAVVLDPPRSGAKAQAQALAQAGPPVVAMASCEPATMARDARILVDGGYILDKITPVDQFPWTAHVEAVAVFRRD